MSDPASHYAVILLYDGCPTGEALVEGVTRKEAILVIEYRMGRYHAMSPKYDLGLVNSDTGRLESFVTGGVSTR